MQPSQDTVDLLGPGLSLQAFRRHRWSVTLIVSAGVSYYGCNRTTEAEYAAAEQTSLMPMPGIPMPKAPKPCIRASRNAAPKGPLSKPCCRSLKLSAWIRFHACSSGMNIKGHMDMNWTCYWDRTILIRINVKLYGNSWQHAYKVLTMKVKHLPLCVDDDEESFDRHQNFKKGNNLQ